MSQKNLKSNIWKLFIYMLTTRRNYIVILSLYFLTLPNSTAQQIGLYVGIGYLAGFLFEIPSGYISDRLGHKQALIIAKISFLISTISFISGTHLINFIMGSIFIAVGFAFTSGTQTAFLHNTLINLKKENKFSKIFGKMQANVSLISVIMILTLPLLTKISMILPIKIYLIFDLIGLFISFFLKNPKIKNTAEDEEGKNILSQLKKFKGSGFYITSLFFGLIAGIMMAMTSFNIPYAERLGLPIIFAGFIMGISRIFWFIIGHNLEKMKKIKMKKIIIFEIFFFSSIFIISSQITGAYIFVLLLALLSGYFQARGVIVNEYFLKNFLINKKYKATMLSIKSQIGQIFQSVFAFIIGIVMGISFKLGYLTAGLTLLIGLTIIYQFLKKYLK